MVSIGLIPDTSASPVTYPVTIGITGQAAAALHANSFADVTITTGQSRGVSVPTSAVHYSATVTVYSAGKIHSVKVRIGTKGLVMTRITAWPQGWPARGARRPAQAAAEQQPAWPGRPGRGRQRRDRALSRGAAGRGGQPRA